MIVKISWFFLVFLWKFSSPKKKLCSYKCWNIISLQTQQKNCNSFCATNRVKYDNIQLMINIMMLQRVCILFSVLIWNIAKHQTTKKPSTTQTLFSFAKGYFDAFFLFSFFLIFWEKKIIIFSRVFLTILILYSTRLYFWKGFEGAFSLFHLRQFLQYE